jgi:hypothetical protein
LISNLGTEEHAILVEGLIDHEAMHCRFSDFEAFRGLSPIVASLANLLEDIWGEREQSKIYPGCSHNIRRAVKVMLRLGWFGPSTGTNESPASVMMNFLINGLRARVYKFSEISGFADQCRSLLESMLGSDLVTQIWGAACKVDDVMSTFQAITLAKEIIALLEQSISPNPAQGANGQEKTSNQLASGEGAAKVEGKSASPSLGGEVQPVDEHTCQDQMSVEEEKRKDNAIKQILDAVAGQFANGDMGDRLMAALSGEGKAGMNAYQTNHAENGAGGSRPDGGQSGYTDVQPKLVDRIVKKQHHHAAVALSRSIEVKLGTKLESLLEARTDSFVLHKRSGHRLDSRRAPRLSVGKTDVFRKVEEDMELDTAVFMLVDCSVSMFADFMGKNDASPQESRVVAAVAVAYAAAQVLNKHDIPFGMACFGEKHLPLKSFSDKWGSVRQFGMTDSLCGTYTDSAVMRITADLIPRDEARKLVILVTDGEPLDHTGTLAVMNEVRMLGTEFSVLFIGTGGEQFEKKVKGDGYFVARATTQEYLAVSFFEAVENAF